MANNFDFYSPTRVIFGKNTEGQIGSLIQEAGAANVLIVYGGKSAVRSGLLDTVKKSLDGAGVYYQELSGIVPNPRLDKVYEGIALGKQAKTDFLLAVGGGSVIDTAKAIAYGLAEPERISCVQSAVLLSFSLLKQSPWAWPSRKRTYGSFLRTAALQRSACRLPAS